MDGHWAALEAEVAKIDGDASFKAFRPLIESLQALVGAKATEPAAAGLLLSYIHALHDGKVTLEQAVSMAERGDAKFVQPAWNVGKVFNTHGDLVFKIFTNSLEQLKPPDPGIEVPIVLVVMSAKEAEDLASGAALKGQSETLRQEFADLQKHLADAALADWPKRYHERREAWRPFGAGTDTLEEHVQKALALFKTESGPATLLAPRFLDIQSLGQASRSELRLRRNTGTLVIIDVISLRHPALMRALQVTMLDAYPASFVVTLAPQEGTLKLCRGLTSAFQLRLEESELARRLADPLDDCEELSAMERFPKWMVRRVRDVCGPALKEKGVLGHFKL